MAGNITISNTFATQSGPIPLSQLDTNFSQLVTALNTTANFSNYYADSSGTPNAVVVTVNSPQLFSYTAGATLAVKIANTNTAAATINVNSLGIKNITNTQTGALNAGDLTAGAIVTLIYDGTQFQLQANSTFTNPTVSGNLTLSGGTANGVAYLNGSKVLTTGSALTFNGTQLSVNGTFGAVGLAQVTGVSGVSQPIITALAGSGSTGGYNRSFFKLVSQATTTGWSLVNYGDSSDLFAISTLAGSDKLTISQAGNVTINAPSSGDALTVSGSSYLNGNILTQANATFYNSTGDLYVRAGTSGSLKLGAGGTNSLAILDSSGNLGLGVTPSAWGGGYKGFQVTTGGSIWATNSGGLYSSNNVYYDGTNRKYVFTGPAFEYGQDSAGHKWSIAGSGTAGNAITFTQAMTLDASGNLLVGRTSGFTQSSRLVVEGNSSTTAICGIFNDARSDATSAINVAFYRNGTKVGSIDCTNAATSYVTTSDRRLKENIKPAQDSGAIIDAIEVVEFDWKIGGHVRHGVIAQDLLPVAPESVSVPTDPNDMMGVDYSKLVPMLVKEIQSLRLRVAQLELGNG